MAQTKYSHNPWKQFIQRALGEESSLRVKDGNVIKCRKHTELIMKALIDTADDTGYMTLKEFLLECCKF